MTEADAETKLCCGPPGCGVLHLRLDVVDSLGDPCTMRVCAGSKCMAWRWIMTPDDAMECDDIGRTGDGTPTGYCGHAGKP